MKIAYIVRQVDSIGGRERVLVHKANYFTRNFDYDVHIITMYQEKAGSFFELDKKVSVHYLHLMRPEVFKGGRFKYWLYVRRAIASALFEISPDISISMWWGSEFKVLPFIKDNSRKILEFHFSQYYRYNLYDVNMKSSKNKARLLATNWLENLLVRCYDKLVVLTNEDKRYWKNKKVIVIPNSVACVSSKKSDYSEHTVISAGRLTAQKGFDRLIRIWSRIEHSDNDWKLLIFGDGEDRDNLSKLIKELYLKRVFLMPATSCLSHEMMKASIFAFTSRYEGFAMVLLEAMQCGLPVVSYDTKCGPRDIIVEKVNGFLVEEGDENTFCDKLKILMNDKALRLKMGISAKNIVAQEFSEYSIMNKWKALFEQS